MFNVPSNQRWRSKLEEEIIQGFHFPGDQLWRVMTDIGMTGLLASRDGRVTGATERISKRILQDFPNVYANCYGLYLEPDFRGHCDRNGWRVEGVGVLS